MLRPDRAECLDRTERPGLDRARNVAPLVDLILCPLVLGNALLGLLLSKGLSVFPAGPHGMVLLERAERSSMDRAVAVDRAVDGRLLAVVTPTSCTFAPSPRPLPSPPLLRLHVEAVPGRCLTDRGGVRTPSAALIAASPRSLGPHAFSWIALAFAVATDCINAGR